MNESGFEFWTFGRNELEVVIRKSFLRGNTDAISGRLYKLTEPPIYKNHKSLNFDVGSSEVEDRTG